MRVVGYCRLSRDEDKKIIKGITNRRTENNL